MAGWPARPLTCRFFSLCSLAAADHPLVSAGPSHVGDARPPPMPPSGRGVCDPASCACQGASLPEGHSPSPSPRMARLPAKPAWVTTGDGGGLGTLSLHVLVCEPRPSCPPSPSRSRGLAAKDGGM